MALSSVLGGRGTAGAAGVGRESRRDVPPRWSEEEEADVGRSEEEEGGSITTSFRLNLIGETWMTNVTKSRTIVKTCETTKQHKHHTQHWSMMTLSQLKHSRSTANEFYDSAPSSLLYCSR